MFGLPSVPGLDAVLCAEIGLQSALRRIEPLRLYFLPAGDRVKNPVALLEGDAFSSLLRCVSEAFDWVIVDSPPLNPFADSQCIASRTDAILLVVRWGFTPRRELDYALATLDGLPLLGMVINKFVGPNEAYHHSYYPPAKIPPADPLPSVPMDEEQR
jgi:Mrp family chromosome partitioning ATPase